jgi:ketopantoate reductase
MIVDPVPPPRGNGAVGDEYESWLGDILKNYGSLKPSMLQDIERKRLTEIDFINGYVCDVAGAHDIAVPVNRAIVSVIRDIANEKIQPDQANLKSVLAIAANASEDG